MSAPNAKHGEPTTTSTLTAGAAAPAPTTSTPLPPAGLPPEKCPDAKTCRRYAFQDASTNAARAPRWPTGPDGLVTIRYSINPFGSGLSNEQVQGAVAAAFATWQAAAPKLRFVFDGLTSRAPTPRDGHNDIGFVHASAAHAVIHNDGSVMVEADMLFGGGPGSWTWEPCENRDGSCTNTNVPNSTGGCCRKELQAAVTHEAGHWLWLGDMTNDALDRELTMSPRVPFNDRWRSTLALGDVLGVRALYPCSCPLPPIYAP
ncbi:MAG TPA: hypothetical protein VHF47_06665 [Acidimicrobiales bacterium]|nr:hypothetical protein [Acidimicrobiales bacterium]